MYICTKKVQYYWPINYKELHEADTYRQTVQQIVLWRRTHACWAGCNAILKSGFTAALSPPQKTHSVFNLYLRTKYRS